MIMYMISVLQSKSMLNNGFYMWTGYLITPNTEYLTVDNYILKYLRIRNVPFTLDRYMCNWYAIIL